MSKDKDEQKPQTILLGKKLYGLGEKPIEMKPGEPATVKSAIQFALVQGMDVIQAAARNKNLQPDEHEKFKAFLLAEAIDNGSTGHSFTLEELTLVKKCAAACLGTETYGTLIKIIDPVDYERQKEK